MTHDCDLACSPEKGIVGDGPPHSSVDLSDLCLYYLDRNLSIVVDGLGVLSCAREMSKRTSAPIRGLILIDLERWLNGPFGGPVALWFCGAPERYFDQAALVAVQSALQPIRG
jgi:hypothetical protein